MQTPKSSASCDETQLSNSNCNSTVQDPCCEERENMASTTFIAAASNGDIGHLKQLLKSGAGVKRVDLNKALCQAAFNNHNDCLEVLIEAGADVNVNPVIRETFTPTRGSRTQGI